MEAKIPAADPNHGECPANATPQQEWSFERWKAKMERITAAQKKKGALLKKNKVKDRLTSHVNWCEALKRGQRYLGLRPLDCPDGLPVPDPSLPWGEQQKFEKEQKLKYGHILEPLGFDKLAPHPFDKDVVFVAVDVEAYEKNHNIITEVGISTLDTADIKDIVPGLGGFNWMERIRSRHFRVSEHVHYTNDTFVSGAPDLFLFGRSEFVSIDGIGRAIDSCFEPPYSKGFEHDGKFKPQDSASARTVETVPCVQETSGERVSLAGDGTLSPQDSDGGVNIVGPTNAEQHLANQIAAVNILGDAEVAKDITNPTASHESSVPSTQSTENPVQSAKPSSANTKPKNRNIILLGHDLEGDLHYLSTLKSAIFTNPPPKVYPQDLQPEHPLRARILESLDTANLYQVWKREPNIASLGRVLLNVERTGWHLHNGGNDARYTMEAFIGVVVKTREEEGGERSEGAVGEKGEDGELERVISERKEAVEREERENRAMWEYAMGGNGYGQRAEVVLPGSYRANDETAKENRLAPNSEQSACSSTSPANSASATQIPPANVHSYTSVPLPTRDGGQHKPWSMPPPKAEKIKNRSSGSTSRRAQILQLQETGQIERPEGFGPEDVMTGGRHSAEKQDGNWVRGGDGGSGSDEWEL
jgi:hypothetical protein